MKHIWKDMLYIALVVAIAFGVSTVAFPKVTVTSALEPVVLLTEEPAPANYIEAIEAVANSIDGIPYNAAALVLSFWHPECNYCIEELKQLNLLAAERPDVVIIALTTETNKNIVAAVIDELELEIGVLYGFPGDILAAVPHTHILMMVDGTWKLKPDGTWKVYTDMPTFLGYITKEERANNQT